MTTTEERKSAASRPEVAAAAARASIAIRERSGREVPQWIRDAAEGRPTTPPAEQPGPRRPAGGPEITTTEKRTDRPAGRPLVAAAAARASIALRERTGRDVPQWIRDTAEGRPTTPPAGLS
ncbi:hypothetical protein [Rhodococcus sp. 1168]|uniref:hypothetical protein n=1 Tax=Rhodococcus sp. 1168 TaxID=2018041 RepID=UPI000F747ADA|nr:hypothetical protein [Rhodococcus sp. 1168]